MEQNKVLMIIVSVAIFFAAIVGVGVALLYPRNDDAEVVAEGGAAPEFDPIEYVRRPEQAPLADSGDDEQVIIVYGERDDADAGDEGESSETMRVESGTADDSDETAGDSAAGERTITIEPATSSGQPSRTAADTSEPEEPSPAEVSSQPERSVSTDTGSDESRQLRETRSEPRRIRVTEYWIQLIASPNRDRVEQVRGTLADYSLGGRVTTRDVDGELYYRLRVGPYDNHDEAEKFLDWIREIEGFESAYISEEYPLRTVNG